MSTPAWCGSNKSHHSAITEAIVIRITLETVMAPLRSSHPTDMVSWQSDIDRRRRASLTTLLRPRRCASHRRVSHLPSQPQTSFTLRHHYYTTPLTAPPPSLSSSDAALQPLKCLLGSSSFTHAATSASTSCKPSRAQWASRRQAKTWNRSCRTMISIRLFSDMMPGRMRSRHWLGKRV